MTEEKIKPNLHRGICIHFIFDDDENAVDFAIAKEAYWRQKACEMREQVEAMEAQLQLLRMDHQQANETWSIWEREVKLLKGELEDA